MASCFGRVAARIVAAGGAIVAVASIGSTLAIGQGCSEKAPPPAAAEPIVIGVSLGLTKDLDTFTAPLRDAVRVAEGEINAAGGLLGRPVVFDVQDDRSDEGEFVKSVANDFVKKKVVAVIGPVGSQQVKVTQDIYAAAQIIQLTPSATSTELAGLQPQNGDRYLFRTTPDDAFQGAAVMLFAQKTPRGIGDAGAPVGDGGVADTCNKLAIVQIDNSYGNAMGDVIEQTWPKRPTSSGTRTVVQRKKISTELAPSYATDAAEIIAKGPECLVLISYEKTAAQFVTDFKKDPGFPALESKGFFFIGTDGVFTPGFLELTRENPSDETSKSYAEQGVYGTNPDTQPITPEYQQFRTLYSSYFPLRAGVDAPPFTANTFDAAVLIAFAIQKAGTATDHVAIRDALREVATPTGRPVTPSQIGEALIDLRNGNDVDYKGASGPCDFAPNGNVSAGFIIWEAFRDPASKRVDYRTVERFSTEDLQDVIK